MSVNEELVRQVWKQIESDPASWSQRAYLITEQERLRLKSKWVNTDHFHREAQIAVPGCGTSYCFAGWALQLSGCLDGGYLSKHVQEDLGVGYESFFAAAALMLGLNYAEARSLFHFFPGDLSGSSEEEQLAAMKTRVEQVTGVKL